MSFILIKFDIGGKKVAGKALFALKSSRNVYLLHVDEGGNSTNFTINIKEKNKYILLHLTDILFSNIFNYC